MRVAIRMEWKKESTKKKKEVFLLNKKNFLGRKTPRFTTISNFDVKVAWKKERKKTKMLGPNRRNVPVVQKMRLCGSSMYLIATYYVHRWKVQTVRYSLC